MDRRQVLLATTGAAMAVAATAATTAPQQPSEPHHHHDAGGSPLLASAEHCVKTGEVCQAHCFDRLAEGDKSLAACGRSVTALIAVCGALATLAAQNSPLLPHFAGVAKEQCNACEEECRKHEKHAPCKACAEACADCANECAKIAA
jgi:Cys-rich four helix bundle protein (predicted Tat secretion target)